MCSFAAGVGYGVGEIACWHGSRHLDADRAVGYDGVVACEHKDPIVSPDDAAEECIDYPKPLLIERPREDGGGRTHGMAMNEPDDDPRRTDAPINA